MPGLVGLYHAVHSMLSAARHRVALNIEDRLRCAGIV